MFKVHIPDPIYERLPAIYLLVALALLVAPLAPMKWLAIGALVAVSVMIRRKRQVFREAERNRQSTAVIEKYRVGY